MTTGKRRLEGLEAFLLVVLGGFALAFLIRAKEFGATAALFPRIVAVVALVLLIAMLAVRFMEKGSATARRVTASERTMPQDSVLWPAALGTQLVYVGLIIGLGFPVATLLYLLIAPWQMGYRRWRVLLPYTLLMTITVTAVFVYLFNVRLPDVLFWELLDRGR